MEANDTNWLDPRTWGPPVLGLIVAASSYLRRKRAIGTKAEPQEPHQNGGKLVEAVTTGFAEQSDTWEKMFAALRTELDAIRGRELEYVRQIADLKADIKVQVSQTLQNEVQLGKQAKEIEWQAAEIRRLTAELARFTKENA